jgi:hypothetical protein
VKAVVFEDGPLGGSAGVWDRSWALSWMRVIEDAGGDYLAAPGECGRGELYVLASEDSSRLVYRHHARRRCSS